MKLLQLLSCILIIAVCSCKDDSCIICDGDSDFALIDFEPAWSPDGQTIAYIHEDVAIGKTGIYLIDTNGTNKRLVYSGVRAYSPAWSPNGEWIAFSDAKKIHKIRVIGDSLTQLTFAGDEYNPVWSPDAQWIAYTFSAPNDTSTSGIWIMRPSGFGTDSRKVGLAGFPTWHPNSQIVLGVRGANSSSIWTRFIKFFPFGYATAETVDVIRGNENYYPRYSPDGMRITFQSTFPGSHPQVWIINSDGADARQLTSTQGYSPAWSPDGQLIVYTDSRGNNGRLWTMKSDGSIKRQLTYGD